MSPATSVEAIEAQSTELEDAQEVAVQAPSEKAKKVQDLLAQKLYYPKVSIDGLPKGIGQTDLPEV